ncbi:MAG: DUF1592 domain-containing protein [Gemmataceae bacterium]|nr:DUF1592 domain-containing protein [Gemmataceae bacterium]
MIHWLEETVLKADPNAVRLVARRLQRAEYMNAARDLFGIRTPSIKDLPKDDAAWDNCNDVPTLSSAYADQYRLAARQILDEVFAAEFLGGDPNADEDDDTNAAPDMEPSSPRRVFAEITGKTDTASAREILGDFARRAYRGPVDAAELDRLVAVFETAHQNEASFEECIYAALEEVLMSPLFLYRVNTWKDSAESIDQPSPCSEVELASRLSFFLWSSVPDDELLDQAQHGILRQNLEAQVKRMLQNPRSKALAKGFSNFWLGLDQLDAVKLDDTLRRAMKKESRMFLAAIIREDRSVLDFLNADFTFVNEALAKHYGIAGVEGDKMRRVDLRGTGRGGLLTQASFLTNTAKTESAAPIWRGKWVLDNLLGEPPAGAPPEVLANREPQFESGLVRLQSAACAHCHAKMDPIGFALDKFDMHGKTRTTGGAASLEPVRVLPDGKTLNGPEDLKAYLLSHHELFVGVLTEKLLSHSQGRKLGDRDRQALAGVAERVAQKQFHFSHVILEVVQSAPFQIGRSE